MPIVIVGNERNFGELRGRLFAGSVSSKVVDEVAAEVKVANPDVDLEHLEPGTVLTIPELPRVNVRGEVSLDESTRTSLSEVASVAKEALEGLVSSGNEREREKAKERKNLRAALESNEVEKAARQDKKLAADVAAVRETLEKEEGRAKERAALLQKAQVEFASGLDALMELDE